MAGPLAQRIVLTDIQRSILEMLVRQRNCPQAIAERARVVLTAEEGLPNAHIAIRLGCSRDLVRRWRNRFALALEQWGQDSEDWTQAVWTEKILDLLEDRERSGAPPTFTPEQLCQIMAIACEERPEECGRPVTHWTARELSDEAVKRGIVPRISPRHVGRFLKGGGPAAAQGARMAQQPRPRRKAPGVPATLPVGGGRLRRRPGLGRTRRASGQHG